MIKPKWVLARVVSVLPDYEPHVQVGKAIWVENTAPFAAPEEKAYDAIHEQWRVVAEDSVYFTYIKAKPGTKYRQVQIPADTVELLPVYRAEMDLVSLEKWLNDTTDPMQLLRAANSSELDNR